MSKAKIVTRLADEIGVSIQKASRFVDDVGASEAQRVLDEMAVSGSRTLSNWARPALLTSGVVGGGALLWRQQNIERARALAEQQQTYQETIQNLVESDLPPDLKEELLRDANQAAGDDSDGSDEDDGGLVPDDPATLVILLIVLAMTLRYALESDG